MWNLPGPGIEPVSTTLTGGCFTTEPLEKLCCVNFCCTSEGESVIVVHSPSHVHFFATPWTIAGQVSLSFTISQSLPKFMSIEPVMPFNHLILCCPLLLLPSVFPSIRVFSSEPALHIKWPKYRNVSFSISSSNEYSGLISFRIDWLISLLSKGLSRVFSSTTIQKHQFFGPQPYL